MYRNVKLRIEWLAHCALLLVLFAEMAGVAEAGSPSEAQAERLILGFEKAELGRRDAVSREEKPGRESWFYLIEQPEGFDFAARFEWPGATNRAWTCAAGRDCTPKAIWLWLPRLDRLTLKSSKPPIGKPISFLTSIPISAATSRPTA